MDSQSNLCILNSNVVSVDQNVIIKLTKQNIESIDDQAQRNCKIIEFTNSEWKFEEVLKAVSNLKPEIYLNLFTFVIEGRNLKLFESTRKNLPEKVKSFHRCLLKFDKNRSMVLQLTSVEENITKIYYKEDNSEEFFDVNDQIVNDERKLNFSTFLMAYLKEGIEKFESLATEKWPNIKNASLISKFLRIFHNSESFWKDLLAATDKLFDQDGEIIESNLISFLILTKKIKPFLNLAVKSSNRKVIKILGDKCSNFIQQIPQKSQVQISNIAFSTNQTILCDLLDFCDFPFPKNLNMESTTHERLHQIVKMRIKFHKEVIDENLAAIDEFAKTYPNLKLVYNLENKSALSNALDARKFKSFFRLKALRFQDNDIENIYDRLDDEADQDKAFKFAGVQRKENVNISTADKDLPILMLATRSFIYNRSDDTSAEPEQREKIKQWYKEIYETEFGCKIIDVASQCKEIKIIFDFGCNSVKDIDLIQTTQTTGVFYPISKWIFIGAKNAGSKQKEQKIKGTISHEICHFVMRMVYQNEDNPYYKDDDKAKDELEKIMIKIKEMLFPQEFDQIEEIDENIDENQSEDLEEQDSNNATDNDDIIENSDDDNNDIIESSDEDDDYEYIDECSGIISVVYNCYDPSVHHIEIIVRPVHIQAQFDHDKEKIKQLELKYKILFKFFEDFIVPELKKFSLKQRRNVQTFNEITGLIAETKKLKLKFVKFNDVSTIFSNHQTIITTNVPKLLLLNLWNFLNKKDEDLLDVQNIFIKSEALNNSYILRSFKEILKQESTLNILVDCSNGMGKISKLVTQSNYIKFCFVVQTENDCEELSEKLEDNELNPTKLTINYTWNDLTPESQKLLLKTKVNFQGNSSLALSGLIDDEIDEQSKCKIVDDRLLKSLVEKSNISINLQNQEDSNDKHFKVLFQSRDLIKVENEEELIDDVGDTKNGVRGDSILKKFLNIPKFIVSKVTKHSTANETSSKVQLKEKTEKMSYLEMLEDVRTSKFVLISDKAGSGKSWMLKNFANKLREKYPEKWISYIDLKQFIDKFKANNSQIKFDIFMIEKILKPRHKYEAEIFKHLYKSGNVCIIFDGFDEIAPDCAELVTELFKSFEQNGSNQLWIATRDYFEINLKDSLQLDVVYKLDEFTEEQGVNLITLSWVLSEVEENNENLSLHDLEEHMKKSENREIFGQNAEELSTKIPKAQTNSIGFPQFYKMMADISKHKKNSIIGRTTFKMFKTCVDIQYERWSKEKGKLRSRANTESQLRELNYYKLHQLIAIESLFPGETKYCDLDLEDLKDWPIEEIISCGLVCRKGDKYFFNHETFREFFAAVFILRMLTQRQNNDGIYKYLIQILTVQKYGIIRMFLNDAFGESTNVEKIMPKMKNIKEKFGNIEIFENSCEIFEEGLQHLANFLIKIFEMSSTNKIIKVLSSNKKIVIFAAKYKDLLFIPIQKFIIDNFDEYELKFLLIDKTTILSIVVEIQDEELTIEFLQKIQDKIKEPDFIKKLLQMHNENGENLLFYLVRSQSVDSTKIQGIFKMLPMFLNSDNIIRLAKEKSIFGINFLQACVAIKNVDRTRSVLEELTTVFGFHQTSFNIMEFLKHKDLKYGKNVLHISAECDKFEYHKMLWEFLLKTFNSDNLVNLIMELDKNGDNYVHCLIYFNNSEVIKLAFDMLKANFNVKQYDHIIRSRGFNGRNLLQKVVSVSKDVKKIQVVIDIFRNSCLYSSDFLKFLMEGDSHDNTVFHTAAMYSTKEVFEFLIAQLAIFNSIKVTKEQLSILGYAEQNIFQSARCNKSFEFHTSLWETMKVYFDYLEISEMIIHPDVYEDSLILNAIEYNTKEIAELTWNEVRKILIPNNEYSDLSEFWIECNDDFNAFLENKIDNRLKLILHKKLKELIRMFKNVDCGVKLEKVLDPENELQDLI